MLRQFYQNLRKVKTKRIQSSVSKPPPITCLRVCLLSCNLDHPIKGISKQSK